MKIRRYEPGDLWQITALFYDTVHAVNAADYAPEQLDAWADGAPDLDRWNGSLLAHHSLVAVEGRDLIVGFGVSTGRVTSTGSTCTRTVRAWASPRRCVTGWSGRWTRP